MGSPKNPIFLEVLMVYCIYLAFRWPTPFCFHELFGGSLLALPPQWLLLGKWGWKNTPESVELWPFRITDTVDGRNPANQLSLVA